MSLCRTLHWHQISCHVRGVLSERAEEFRIILMTPIVEYASMEERLAYVATRVRALL